MNDPEDDLELETVIYDLVTVLIADDWGTERKQLRVHPQIKCLGSFCTIHNPSQHHMVNWPRQWHAFNRVMERICPHGVGHTDPDETRKDVSHGCDGCCRPDLIKAGMNYPEILRLRLDPNDADAATIREYLIKLVAKVWDEEECFSGKRPFGNSGWNSDLDKTLIKHGVVAGTFDSDGYVEEVNRAEVKDIIARTIQYLMKEETDVQVQHD